jgi:hypothetical protein
MAYSHANPTWSPSLIMLCIFLETSEILAENFDENIIQARGKKNPLMAIPISNEKTYMCGLAKRIKVIRRLWYPLYDM